jgi:hypothetical protein
MDVSKVTRFEVLNHTTKAREQGYAGRSYVERDVVVELELQDDGITLKVFLGDPKPLTGLDKVRAAIRRARGGDAPVQAQGYA